MSGYLSFTGRIFDSFFIADLSPPITIKPPKLMDKYAPALDNSDMTKSFIF